MPTDKSGKDNNYRGVTSYNGVVYFIKGSGSNGVDTVYFADRGGSATAGGVGLPSDSETLPSASTWTAPTYSTSDSAPGLTAKNPGLTPTNTDIQAAYAEVVSERCRVPTEPKDHGREIRAYICDPGGHLIEVGQSTPR